VKIGAHELEGPVPEVLSHLAAAEASDDRAEVGVRRYGRLALICFLVGLFGFVPLAVASAFLETTVPVALSPILLVAAVVFKILHSLAKRHDLDDFRLEAAQRVLKMLVVDTPQDARVRLRLDFRSYLKAGRLVAKKGGFFSTVKQKKYVHPWFQLTGALVDGTRYQLSVTDVIGRKTRSKRKYTKVKERFRSQISLRVRVRPRYGAIEPVVATLESLAPPSPLRRLSVQGQGQMLTVRLLTPATNAVQGRYRSTPVDPTRRISGDMLLGALLWTWDAFGRSLKRTA